MSTNENKAKLVLAMEYIARHINDEDIFMRWLSCGVPDGDIEYGDFDITKVDDYFLEDKNLSDLMTLFLSMMCQAYKSGGLYCEGICSKEENE